MTTDPNRKLKVFLCHSSHDKAAVREIYTRLQAEGWIDPWLDEEKLFPGQDWDLEIEKAVEETGSENEKSFKPFGLKDFLVLRKRKRFS